MVKIFIIRRISLSPLIFLRMSFHVIRVYFQFADEQKEKRTVSVRRNFIREMHPLWQI
jgi:hypothetical protein